MTLHTEPNRSALEYDAPQFTLHLRWRISLYCIRSFPFTESETTLGAMSDRQTQHNPFFEYIHHQLSWWCMFLFIPLSTLVVTQLNNGFLDFVQHLGNKNSMFVVLRAWQMSESFVIHHNHVISTEHTSCSRTFITTSSVEVSPFWRWTETLAQFHWPELQEPD